MGVTRQGDERRREIRPGRPIQLPRLVQQPDLRHNRIELSGCGEGVGAAVAQVVEPGDLNPASSK